MEKLYLILDSGGTTLAQATLESPPRSEVMQLRLTEESELDFRQLGEIQCIGLDNGAVSMRGVVTIQRGDRLAVRPVATLGEEARENLRVPTDFESVMYPVTGYWNGQRSIRGHDLSCGGLAFYSEVPLKVGEIVQVVLPVTDEPLLLRARILRELDSGSPMPLYAARFTDVILDEELLIRKAVFNIQVSDVPKRKNTEQEG